MQEWATRYPCEWAEWLRITPLLAFSIDFGSDKVYDFLEFLADVGRAPSALHVIHRRDETLPYGNGNLAWSRHACQVEGPPTVQAHLPAEVVLDIATSLRRLADTHAPEGPDVVGTPYVAKKRGVTTTAIALLAREGNIPEDCIVPATGDGTPWKFDRRKIDEWLRKGGKRAS